MLTRDLAEADRTLSVHGSGFDDYAPPRWIREHIDAEHAPEVVLDDLRERVLQEPSEQSLREAELVLNELTRTKGGTELVRRVVTQEIVDRLTETLR